MSFIKQELIVNPIVANNKEGEIKPEISLLNPTGIGIKEIHTTKLPDNYTLRQNFPNPFNPTTKIQYSIPKSSHIVLTIYDGRGQIVEQLFSGYQSRGTYNATFDASEYASGVYLYRLQADGYSITKKMILLK